jgi:hypothetical protein
MRHKIDHPTQEGLVHLGEVMKQFILWHKKDIILNVSSPTPSDVHLERVVEDGGVYSPARDDHMPHTPHSSPTPSMPHTSPARHTEQEHDEVPHSSPTPSKLLTDKPHASPARHTEQGHDEVPQCSPTTHTEQVARDMPEPPQQAQPIRKRGLPSEKEDEGAAEWEVRAKHPYHIRPAFIGMPNVPMIDKWYSRDKFKPENQVKDLYARANEPPDTSKLHQSFKKYPNVEDINWTEDCPKEYKRGKPFLPNRMMSLMPLGMRRFHDWYLRAQATRLNEIKACWPKGTFGGPPGALLFDFDDIQTCFHLGSMELNLVRVWCL